eukprot:CAMPEP_0117879968 /NCGR_PEP_ID=MMETSP0950-20121206/15857_1 /TAXON_ID=44440 /ORGANISM="Chattonella subsalsa, Strain CCMP2191" /LENGTH=188 /DNA_ID=CAMNT_0005734759 /DNA_START=298 /DNA_END=863 /DNA_ORIENTATION=-
MVWNSGTQQEMKRSGKNIFLESAKLVHMVKQYVKVANLLQKFVVQMLMNLAGPENWEYIFPACAGQEQSPINIVQAQPDKKLGPITFTANKAMGSAVLQLSEHNWEVKVPDEYKPENTVTFNGKKYNLLQFHFHTPAEHAIGGGYYDAEMHLVHQNPDTKELLVVGVMYEAGPYADNTVLKRFWGTGE